MNAVTYRIRAWAGIILLVFFSLMTSFRLFFGWVQSDLTFVGHDDITEYEGRFDKIKERLPAHGIVDYSPNGTAVTPDQLLFGNAGDLRAWLLTQYSLAPVIVSPNPENRLTIINNSAADVSSTDRSIAIRKYEDGSKVFDFGRGVQLRQRETE